MPESISPSLRQKPTGRWVVLGPFRECGRERVATFHTRNVFGLGALGRIRMQVVDFHPVSESRV